MTTTVIETEQYPATVEGPAPTEPRTSASVRSMAGYVASRTKWLLARIAEVLGSFVLIGAVDSSTDTITAIGHGLSADSPVRLLSVGGSVPGPLAAGTVYFAIVSDADHFQLAATAGGAAIDLTTTGSGDLYFFNVVDAAAALFAPAVGALPAGSLRTILQALPALAASQTWSGANIFDDLTMSGTNRVKLEARAITRTLEQAVTPDSYTNWLYSTTLYSWQTNVDTTSRLYAHLHLPHGVTLSTVTAYVKGAPGHAGLPTTMPLFKIWKIEIATGNKTQIGSTATDGSADTTAFQAIHTVQRAGLTEVVDRATYRYLVEFTSESGTNALANEIFFGLSVTYTATAYDED